MGQWLQRLDGELTTLNFRYSDASDVDEEDESEDDEPAEGTKLSHIYEQSKLIFPFSPACDQEAQDSSCHD